MCTYTPTFIHECSLALAALRSAALARSLIILLYKKVIDSICVIKHYTL